MVDNETLERRMVDLQNEMEILKKRFSKHINTLGIHKEPMPIDKV